MKGVEKRREEKRREEREREMNGELRRVKKMCTEMRVVEKS